MSGLGHFLEQMNQMADASEGLGKVGLAVIAQSKRACTTSGSGHFNLDGGDTRGMNHHAKPNAGHARKTWTTDVKTKLRSIALAALTYT
jgi:hypothetical protein